MRSLVSAWSLGLEEGGRELRFPPPGIRGGLADDDCCAAVIYTWVKGELHARRKTPGTIAVAALKPAVQEGYTALEVGSILHLHLWKQASETYVKDLPLSDGKWKTLGTVDGEVIRVGKNNVAGHKDALGVTYGWVND